MQELKQLVSVLILFAVIWNFFNTLKMRKKLTRYSKIDLDSIPFQFQNEIARHIEDGYSLVEVEKNKIKLIKKKRYLFPFLIFLLMPNSINIIFNSSFLCSIYGIELKLVGDKVEISTF
ncbi:hypothetical protein [Aliikangiella maris]|uniref:Uncharacterized protein n=2 Tax=Aliikangiella maris TaxID=3162458 RepID=A0ABV3MNL3_9GAMM